MIATILPIFVRKLHMNSGSPYLTCKDTYKHTKMHMHFWSYAHTYMPFYNGVIARHTHIHAYIRAYLSAVGSSKKRVSGCRFPIVATEHLEQGSP